VELIVEHAEHTSERGTNVPDACLHQERAPLIAPDAVLKIVNH